MQVAKVFLCRVPEEMAKLIGYTVKVKKKESWRIYRCVPVNSNFLHFSHHFTVYFCAAISERHLVGTVFREKTPRN